MPTSRHRNTGASDLPEEQVLNRPAPKEPGAFGRTRTIGDYVILEWDTDYGTIGLAYSLRSSSVRATDLASAVYEQFRDRWHQVYAALVTHRGGLSLDLSPQLNAVDLYPDSVRSKPYEVSWRQLAAVLGTRVPWFDPSLRDRDTICGWRPGDPPAIIPANHVELPVGPLLELAADEPDGSPAAAVCLWLARHLRRLDAEAAQHSIGEIQAEAAGADNDCSYVGIAAVPAPLLRPAEEQPAQIILLGGWAQILERRDVLAAAVARAARQWDSGRSWPVGPTAEFDPASCPQATEWTARLRPGLVGEPPTVLERQLLEHVSSIDRGELLYDDTSGCAAVRRTDHMGNVTIYAGVPQRISTLASLSEVTLSSDTVWIRTGDNGLWLAPSLAGHGLTWGYRGSGPRALAALLDRLLDDITGAPVAYEKGPAGLESLIQETPRDATTTYSRAQLLAARCGP